MFIFYFEWFGSSKIYFWIFSEFLAIRMRFNVRSARNRSANDWRIRDTAYCIFILHDILSRHPCRIFLRSSEQWVFSYKILSLCCGIGLRERHVQTSSDKYRKLSVILEGDLPRRGKNWGFHLNGIDAVQLQPDEVGPRPHEDTSMCRSLWLNLYFYHPWYYMYALRHPCRKTASCVDEVTVLRV